MNGVCAKILVMAPDAPGAGSPPPQAPPTIQGPASQGAQFGSGFQQQSSGQFDNGQSGNQNLDQNSFGGSNDMSNSQGSTQ